VGANPRPALAGIGLQSCVRGDRSPKLARLAAWASLDFGLMAFGSDLSPEALERARRSRDPRFDGRFVIAVASSRIYCRPVCPVSFASSVRFYATAAEAETAGYRPCLRCRPEAAPGSPAWRGTSATVSRALRLIEEGALDRGSVTTLAARVGIGARHLNRLMTEQVGAPPLAIAQTRRLHFAKLLLSDTAMSITDIALASGYGSVRRFNDAFKAAYRRAPSEIRRRPPPGEAANRITLRLAYRPPFDWAQTLALLAGEAVPGVERAAAGSYARAVQGADGPVLVEITDRPASRALSMQVRGAGPADLSALATTARRVFDLTADPARITCAFQDDALLGPLVRARPGLRLLGVWSRFEAMVRAVLEDHPALSRLAERFGARIDGEESGLTRLFPRPEEVAFADLEAIGLSAARSETLRGVARAVLDGTLKPNDAPERVMQMLARIPGFGESRAQWVGLRGYEEPDAFPSESLRLPPCGREPAADAVAIRESAEAWRPWRGYAFFHLLAAARGVTASETPGPGEDGSPSPPAAERIRVIR
jgi:AraC family transcriptional regulator of adaptative response / DNA-3-methyladenine glycosylase II